MDKGRGHPSSWLLRNSKGYPDFLFTILTYSILLLIFVAVMWVIFGILAFKYGDDAARAEVILKAMDSFKTGLIALAGVVFSLAGSYTVRRFKKDDHWLEKTKHEAGQEQQDQPALPTGDGSVLQAEPGLGLVQNMEDI